MNKIDEIALRVASEIGAVSYSPPPFRAVRGYSFTYDDLWRFTRALVADPELLAELRKDESPVIASEQKPVCEGYIRDGKIIAVKLKDVELVMRLPEGVTLESLYLHPAPIPEWQPIETAPKDGTDIIVMYMYLETQVVHNAFWNCYEDADPDEIGWWSYDKSEVSRIKLDYWMTPSHWMPLPPMAAARSE